MERKDTSQLALHDLLRRRSGAIRLMVDVGCGRGVHLNNTLGGQQLQQLKSAGVEIWGIDVTEPQEVNPYITSFQLIQPNGRWPIDNSVADLVFSDWVLEHVADPALFFSECARVLRPEGVLIARTLQRWSVAGIGARLVPQKFHQTIIGYLQPGMKSDDIFPVALLCNTRNDIMDLCQASGLRLGEVTTHLGLYGYGGDWTPLQATLLATESVLPPTMHQTIVFETFKVLSWEASMRTRQGGSVTEGSAREREPVRFKNGKRKQWVARTDVVLSIVMAAFNEAETIESAVGQVLETAYPCPVELIVVDDGSTDGTADRLSYLTDPRLRIHRHPRNLGKGAALMTGLVVATGTHLLPFDADLEYSAHDIGRLLEPILAGHADVVYGTRLFGLNTVYHSFRYKMGNRATTLAANVLFDSAVTDIHTCLKLVPTDVLRTFHLTEERFGLDTEITANVLRAGYRPFEVPVAYYSRSHLEGKKINWRDGVRCLAVLGRVRFMTPAPRSTGGGAPTEAACANCGSPMTNLAADLSRQGNVVVLPDTEAARISARAAAERQASL